MFSEASNIPPIASPEDYRSGCLDNLGKITAKIADMNRSGTGQYIRHSLSDAQAEKFKQLQNDIPNLFRESQATASGYYRTIGSKMCEGCLGREGCPFRTYDTTEGPKPHIDTRGHDRYILAALEAWYQSLKPSARKNIRKGKVTPTTKIQSRVGTTCAHKTAA